MRSVKLLKLIIDDRGGVRLMLIPYSRTPHLKIDSREVFNDEPLLLRALASSEAD